MSLRQVRVVRGAAAAAVATFIALLSHVVGGGELPGLLGILVPLVASLWPAVLLAGRRLSLWRLSVSVAISQALFHCSFVLGATSGGTIPATAHLGHTAPSAAMITPAAMASSAHAAGAAHADPLMWLSHGVAAIVTIAVLYRGERMLLRLRQLATQMVEWLRRRIALVPVVPFPAPRLRPVASWSRAASTERPELSPLLRRGPPLSPAV